MNCFPDQYPLKLKTEIMEFLEGLEPMGSLVDDWDVDYMDKIEGEDEELFACIKRRKINLKRYMDYAEETF